MSHLNLIAGTPNIVELDKLYEAIEAKEIALPIFQRSYLWNDEEKRLLLKSLAANLTIGSIILWHPVNEPGMPFKKIDGFELPDEPDYLILDGQQRLTFLSKLNREAESGTQNNGSYEYYIKFDNTASFRTALPKANLYVAEFFPNNTIPLN